MKLPDLEPQIWTLVVNEGANFVAALIILVAGWWLASALARWIEKALARVRNFDPTLKPLVGSVARYSIIAVTVIAVLERFGVQTTSLIAVLGAAGLAIGLALQGTLSNVASGVMLLLIRVFRVGDEIVTAGFTGTVREIGLFRTVLISNDGLYVSIPNASVFTAAIVNNSREPTRQVNFKITVDHTVDVGKAQELILGAIRADERVLKNPAPGAVVVELGDFDVVVAVTAWTLTSIFGAVQSDLQKAVRQNLRDGGVSPPRRIVSIDSANGAWAAAVADEPQKRKAAG